MKTIDKYVFQALDSYPYSLEETIESLDYAFSYDAKNTMVLCLYGRIQAEQLLNYEAAKNYFEEAFTINIHALEVYPYYIQTLILNEDYEEAMRLIDFALTIKGISKADIFVKKAILFEVQHKFKKAMKEIRNDFKCSHIRFVVYLYFLPNLALLVKFKKFLSRFFIRF